MKQLVNRLFLLPFILLITCNQASFAKEQPLDEIVATVNNDAITQQELSSAIVKISKQMQERNVALPDAETLKKQVLDHLIDQQLQLQQAKEMGFSISESELNKVMINIAAQNKLSLSDFRMRLKEDGYDYNAFRDELQNEMLIDRLQKARLQNSINVSQREVSNQLKQYKSQQDKLKEYHLKRILIPLSENPSAAEISKTKQKVTNIIKQLSNNTSFSKLAAGQSTDQNALKGGDLGWRKSAEIPSIFAKDVPEMKVGEFRGPFRSSNGFHIIKLVDTRYSSDLPLQIKTKARRILLTNNDDSAKRQLNQIRQRVIKGEKFSELAKAYSQDTSTAQLGGHLDWVALGERSQAFDAAVGALSEGEISKPFKDQEGWQIVQVLKRKDTTEDYVKDQITQQIYNRKFQEALQNWLSQLREQTLVVIKDPNLKQAMNNA